MDATIRPAGPDDAAAIADMHYRSRKQAFKGHIADEILDDLEALERDWAAFFRAPDGRVAVAEVDDEIVGIAYGIPGERTELRNLYLLESASGSGVAQRLLDGVIHPGESAFLWVADFNDRAKAFYTKLGFTFDGEKKTHQGDNVALSRMVRD